MKIRSIYFSAGVSSLVESEPARVIQFRPMIKMIKPSKYLLAVI